MDKVVPTEPAQGRDLSGRFGRRDSYAHNDNNLLDGTSSAPSIDGTTDTTSSHKKNDKDKDPGERGEDEGIISSVSAAAAASKSSSNASSSKKRKVGRPRNGDGGNNAADTQNLSAKSAPPRRGPRRGAPSTSRASTPVPSLNKSHIPPINNTTTPIILSHTPASHPVSTGTTYNSLHNSSGYAGGRRDTPSTSSLSLKRPPPALQDLLKDGKQSYSHMMKRPRTSQCIGLYEGTFGQAISFAGKSMIESGRKLIEWSRESDFGMKSFNESSLFSSKNLLLSFRDLDVVRPSDPTKGFAITSAGCRGEVSLDYSANGNTPFRCQTCTGARKKGKRTVQEIHNSTRLNEPAHKNTKIVHLAREPAKAEEAIRLGRQEVRRLQRLLAKTILKGEIEKMAIHVSYEKGREVNEAINIMSDRIEDRLESGGDTEACELWKIHRENLNQHFANGRQSKIPVHPTLLNWAMAFLAKNSSTMYKEVQKIMKLPSISYVYKKMAELVSRDSDKGYSIHIQTLETLGKRANDEDWSKLKRTGCVAQDSANINKGIQHDYVTNELVGGDESHKIGTLTKVFSNMAKKVKDAAAEDAASSIPEPEQPDKFAKTENSILDEMRLAKDHLVFKWTTIDPDGYNKESFIVASINVEKVSPELVATVQEVLQDTLPAYGLSVGFGTSDAAGANWVGYSTIATQPISDVLPKGLMDKFPAIDFDLVIVYQDPITGEYVLFIPDMPHLTKNIVTALELSGSKFSKRRIKFGKCPVDLVMVEDIWIKSGGTTNQLQVSKLTLGHLRKNAFSRMDVAKAAQVLSATVTKMIRDAIKDDRIVLPLRNKGMYHHLANLCERWDWVVDLCNDRDGPSDPTNAVKRQTKLLETLDWFTTWKSLHDELVKKGDATEYNFFADETWFCIRALILGHTAAIQIYCVEKNGKLRHRSINTDVVEWFFGDGRQMVGGSTNKMTAVGWNNADAKSNVFLQARHNLVGNNKAGEVMKRQARF